MFQTIVVSECRSCPDIVATQTRVVRHSRGRPGCPAILSEARGNYKTCHKVKFPFQYVLTNLTTVIFFSYMLLDIYWYVYLSLRWLNLTEEMVKFIDIVLFLPTIRCFLLLMCFFYSSEYLNIKRKQKTENRKIRYNWNVLKCHWYWYWYVLRAAGWCWLPGYWLPGSDLIGW